jgi:dihydrofolate synthase/folylpolyglutamate synthase
MVKCEKMHIVFGMVNDKDIDSVLEMLPKQAIYYFTKAETKRALNEQSVRLLAVNHGISGNCYPSVDEAYRAAMEQAGENDFVFVGGSSYVVGDFLKTCV